MDYSVMVGVINQLPMNGIDMLMGNDLAGSRMYTPPLPRRGKRRKKPKLIPNQKNTAAGVITRLQTKMRDKEGNEGCKSRKADSRMNSKPEEDIIYLQTTKEKLIEKQKSDPDLEMYFALGSSNSKRRNNTPEYYTYEGVLMRRWKPKVTPCSEDWANRNQIMLPSSHRTPILKTVLEIPQAGHLGINKSYDKITRYWTGIKRDVAKFSNSSHVCQIARKAKNLI